MSTPETPHNRPHEPTRTRATEGFSAAGLSGLTEVFGLLPASPGHDVLLGTTLGDVRLVRLVAEGGMGRVYEGLQEKPRRTVAVKVIRPGVVSPHLIKRFEYEAQLLGRLTHPGIAQIHAIGSQEVAGTVVPFFVMEFIPDARPLTDFAAGKTLSTHERVALFRKVCDAVAHGHHKGIIHRDLKPTNILVDATGQPKVIDFGVARSTDSDVALTTMHTDVGQLIGTLQYMCPEQFDANPDDIDVRADVYALGVVLYELLAGKPPYELKKKAVFEAARVVREVDPTPLSSWNRTLRRDIATIAAKCLEKDRSKRYSSASELAADLGRYLAGEPIAATPPRFIDAVVRLARRHRAAAVAAGGILTALVLAFIGISFFALRADEARREALAETARSRSHAAAAEAAEGRATAETLAAKAQLYRAHVRASDASIYEHNSPGATHARRQAGASGWRRSPVWCSRPHRGTASRWGGRCRLRCPRIRGGQPPAGCGLLLSADHVALPPRMWAWREGQAAPFGGILASGSSCRLAAVSPPRGVMACVHGGRLCEITNLTTSRAEAVLEGSFGRITALAFSPTGGHLAVAATDFDPATGVMARVQGPLPQRRTSLTIWDTRSWQRIGHFACTHAIGPDAIALSPAGDLVAMAVGTGAEVRSLAEPEKIIALGGHRGRVSGVAFSPDGTRLATGSVNPDWSGTVNVWNLTTGASLGTLERNPGRSAWGARLVFSPAGDRIAITFGDRHAHLWDGSSADSVPLVGHGGRVFAVAFFPDGDEVATCSADFTVRTWNAATGRPGRVFMGLANEITHLAIDADGSRIAAVDTTGNVGVWCVAPRQEPSVLRAPAGVRTTHLAVRPDGSHVAASCGDGILRIWDARSGVALAGLSQHDLGSRAGLQHLAYSPDGSHLAATAGDGLTSVWDVRTLRLVHSLPSRGESSRSMAYSADGRLLAVGFVSGKAKVWETATGRELATTKSVQSDIGCCRVAFGLDGGRLATGTSELWDPATGRAAAPLAGEGQVTSLAASPDGRLFASTTMSGAASIWAAATGARVCSLPPHHEAARVVAFSPDGELVATGGFDMIVRLSKAATGELVHALTGHTGWIQSLAFSRDGTRLVTGAWDNTARVWDTTSGEMLLVLRGHDDYVKGLAFSPQADRIYSCSFDGTVRIWGGSNRDLVRAAATTPAP
ncbi:MAG: WD40 repeat domain-containing serine/threonine protein kinase [Planctomycetia bacterium]